MYIMHNPHKQIIHTHNKILGTFIVCASHWKNILDLDQQDDNVIMYAQLYIISNGYFDTVSVDLMDDYLLSRGEDYNN